MCRVFSDLSVELNKAWARKRFISSGYSSPIEASPSVLCINLMSRKTELAEELFEEFFNVWPIRVVEVTIILYYKYKWHESWQLHIRRNSSENLLASWIQFQDCNILLCLLILLPLYTKLVGRISFWLPDQPFLSLKIKQKEPQKSPCHGSRRGVSVWRPRHVGEGRFQFGQGLLWVQGSIKYTGRFPINTIF